MRYDAFWNSWVAFCHYSYLFIDECNGSESKMYASPWCKASWRKLICLILFSCTEMKYWQMGLGKTLQAIAFLCYLKFCRRLPGPFCESAGFGSHIIMCILFEVFLFTQLVWMSFFFNAVVLCPLSVIDGWVSEIGKFASKLRVLRYVGEKEHRRILRKTMYEHVQARSSSSDVIVPWLLITSKLILWLLPKHIFRIYCNF